MMAVFRFDSGHETHVDDEDLQILKEPGWRVKLAGSRLVPYVYRKLPGVNTPEYLHRKLAGARPGDKVRHIDENTLNNRKRNFMRVVPNAVHAEVVEVGSRGPMRRIGDVADEDLRWRVVEAFNKMGIRIEPINVLIMGDRVVINTARDDLVKVLGRI